MIAEIPPTEVEGRIAVCDGRESPDAPAALGHPRLYINLVSTMWSFVNVWKKYFISKLLMMIDAS